MLLYGVFEIKNLDLVHENFKIEIFVESTQVWGVNMFLRNLAV